jgi:thiosulfate/3-mercaptopyruvate sulfurtransferase
MYPDLIEPADLSQHLGDENLMIIDLSRYEVYQQYHIPGAIHVAPEELISGEKPATGRLPSLSRINALFARIGYSPDKHVVAYDDEGGGWAGRFIWTLDVIGHTHSSYLNGGLIAWMGEKFPTTDEILPLATTNCDLTITTDVIAEKTDVLKSIGSNDVLIWDARSPEEYAGTRVVAARGGHVPGAINLDWLELMDRNNHLKLKSDLASVLSDRGISPDATIITHCQTHHRSGLTYLVGKLLGLNILAYHGSWSEWGNDPDTPIDNPSGQ